MFVNDIYVYEIDVKIGISLSNEQFVYSNTSIKLAVYSEAKMLFSFKEDNIYCNIRFNDKKSDNIQVHVTVDNEKISISLV